MRKTIGLLGGSFNPIHYGHLQMAQVARDVLGLDRVILMPDGDPPHKKKELANKRDRLRMAEIAVQGVFEVSSMEVERPGKTYTVDTLEALTATYPDADIIMLIGADTLGDLLTWRNVPRVFSLCRFAVFSRGDMPLPDVPGATVMRVHADILGISATEIRKRVHRGMSLEGLTPPAVIDYIGRQRLYNPPVRMCKKEIRKRLKHDLPNGRFRHVLEVEATMEALADRWGYSVKRAGLAGLLHDCAKGLSLEAMCRLVDGNGLLVDAGRRTSRELLHAPASAAMARAVYGVTDPEILHAIWYHNTGSMTLGEMDKLLFVADMIEPGRKATLDLEPIRRMAFQDLNEAVCMAFRHKLAFIEAMGKGIHPDTKAAYEAAQKNNDKEAPA